MATVDGIGAGKENTIKIISTSHPGGSVNASNCAAYACNNYFTGTTKAGEWYLPSKMELDLIYKNLVKYGWKINSDSWHWSSSRNSYYSAWDQSFSGGTQEHDGKDDNYCVRAVRAF